MKAESHEAQVEHAQCSPSQLLLEATSPWDRFRDTIDGNRRCISICLYSLFGLLLISVKKSISDYRLEAASPWDRFRDTIDSNRRCISIYLYSLFGLLLIFVCVQINRIRRQSDIPRSVYEKRKCLTGIVFSVGPQGHIFVNHIPLLHAVLPFLPLTPLSRTRRASECIALRLDTVDLVLGGGESQESVSAPALPSQDQAAGESCESGPSSVACLRDLAAYLVARGLAVTSDSSFSPDRQAPSSSSFHYLRSRLLQRLERGAAALNVGMWSQMEDTNIKERLARHRSFFGSVRKRLPSLRSLWRAVRHR